jgi:hypothetical protein
MGGDEARERRETKKMTPSLHRKEYIPPEE